MALEIFAKRFYVLGTVQGVGFRFFVERVAGKLNISGYVKNLLDGRVEVYAIGNLAQLGSLRNELQRGPRMAHVVRVDENDADRIPQYASSFTIIGNG